MATYEGHRSRRKAQFLEHGLDAFADYEVLELLLFYALPRQDTKPIAKALLERFGSLEAVFSTPVEELQTVQGIGESAALLLHLVIPLYRRMRVAEQGKQPYLNSVKVTGEYVKQLFIGAKEEEIYLLCLDNQCRLLSTTMVSDGTVGSAYLNVRRVLQVALLNHAAGVILTHNHPSGSLVPSKEDCHVTHQLKELFQMASIRFVDHIIVANEQTTSMASAGLLL